MEEINGKIRRQLEKCAHSLEHVVIVGANGVTEQVVKMVSTSLDAHELIKIKFNEFKDEKRELSEKICEETGAALIRIIGNIAIVFKQNKDPKKRKYNIEK